MTEDEKQRVELCTDIGSAIFIQLHHAFPVDLHKMLIMNNVSTSTAFSMKNEQDTIIITLALKTDGGTPTIVEFEDYYCKCRDIFENERSEIQQFVD
jgi:hypothetical protein